MIARAACAHCRRAGAYQRQLRAHGQQQSGLTGSESDGSGPSPDHPARAGTLDDRTGALGPAGTLSREIEAGARHFYDAGRIQAHHVDRARVFG